MNPTRIPFHPPYWARQGMRGTKSDRVQHELILGVQRDSIIGGRLNDHLRSDSRISQNTAFCQNNGIRPLRTHNKFYNSLRFATPPPPRNMGTRYLWWPCLSHWLLLWACMYVLIWAYASTETQHLVVRRRTVKSVEKINCGLCHHCHTGAVRRRCVWRYAFWKILFQPTDTS